MHTHPNSKADFLMIAAGTLCFCLSLLASCDQGIPLNQNNLNNAPIFQQTTPAWQTPTATSYGCQGTNMLPVPEDPLEPGPWPVVSKYVYVNTPSQRERTRVQILYPAVPGSEIGYTPVVLDTPDLEFYIPDIENIVRGKSYPTFPSIWYDEELPLDRDHGPYPVIEYVHGTTSGSLCHYKMLSHWASRGFVVIAADHNGICMKDMLENFATFFSKTEKADVRYILNQVRAQSGPFAFLRGAIDTNRMGISGHSWGGRVVGELAGEAGVKVIIPMASSGVHPASSVEQVMVMGAMQDNVLNWNTLTQPGYRATSQPKRLIGIPRAGHMAFSDFCPIVVLHEEFNFNLDPAIALMATDGCNDGVNVTRFIDEDDSMDIIKYASAAMFEETLQCSPTATEKLTNIKSEFRDVAPELVYQHAPNGGATGMMPNFDMAGAQILMKAASGMGSSANSSPLGIGSNLLGNRTGILGNRNSGILGFPSLLGR